MIWKKRLMHLARLLMPFIALAEACKVMNNLNYDKDVAPIVTETLQKEVTESELQ